MIDVALVERVATNAAMGAMNRGGERIVASAKRHAPVRKVFPGQTGRERVRVKTMSEVRDDRATRRALGLGPEHHLFSGRRGRQNPATIIRRGGGSPGPQMLGKRRVRGQVPNIEMSRSYDPPPELSRQGRYELRTGRAVARVGRSGRRSLGGRLRDEIHFEAAVLDGKRILLKVKSPTPYAKYQEFGTRHHPAHPYMRPGLHENLRPLRADLATSIAGAVRSSFRGRISVVVEI